MAPFDDFLYWLAIVSIALSCTTFALFDVKSRLRVTQGHWKWHHSEAWVRFPIRISQQL